MSWSFAFGLKIRNLVQLSGGGLWGLDTPAPPAPYRSHTKRRVNLKGVGGSNLQPLQPLQPLQRLQPLSRSFAEPNSSHPQTKRMEELEASFCFAFGLKVGAIRNSVQLSWSGLVAGEAGGAGGVGGLPLQPLQPLQHRCFFPVSNQLTSPGP